MKTKDKVLDILKGIQGDYISGQDIADRIYVTRASVWKAIKALQEDGYCIDAVTNKGYRLRYLPDLISEEEIEKALADSGINMNVYYYDKVMSTNDTALEILNAKGEGTLVIAESQVKGRGRRGREFYSPQNTGLYMSLAFRSEKSIAEYKNITAMTASACALAIDRVAFAGEDRTQIKWVNDIFVDGYKVAGILTECFGSMEDGGINIVIGIGINVYAPEKDFPKEIRNIAGALFSGGRIREGNVRSQICIELIKNLTQIMTDDTMKEMALKTYKAKSFLIGSYVKVHSFSGNDQYAYVDGITDEYELQVTYDDGRKANLITGEVSVVKY